MGRSRTGAGMYSTTGGGAASVRSEESGGWITTCGARDLFRCRRPLGNPLELGAALRRRTRHRFRRRGCDRPITAGAGMLASGRAAGGGVTEIAGGTTTTAAGAGASGVPFGKKPFCQSFPRPRIIGSITGAGRRGAANLALASIALALQRLLEEIADDVERIAARPGPSESRIVTRLSLKPTQAPADQLRVHQDEPAVGVVLGGAGLAGHVGPDAEAAADARRRCPGRSRRASCRAASAPPRSTSACSGACGWNSASTSPSAVLDARDQHRLDVAAVVGDGAVGRHHFLQRDRAGAQRQRRHRVELALRARPWRAPAWPRAPAPTLCITCAVMVFFEYTRPSRSVIGSPVGPSMSVGRQTLPSARRISTASSMKASSGLDALFEGGAVDEGLEGRAGLAPRLLHMVELVLREVAAADPGLDVAVGRVHAPGSRPAAASCPATAPA